MTTQSLIVSFTLGVSPDHKGRTIEELWQLDRFWLEHCHDYIQWLFPIPEPGCFNGFAPLLDPASQVAFAKDQELRLRQQNSLSMMLEFLGLETATGAIVAKPELNIRDHIWLKQGGHNHLRISRMIRSLHFCHQPELAKQLQQAVMTIGPELGQVSEKTLGFWRQADKEV